jgi:hypothetical protein
MESLFSGTSLGSSIVDRWTKIVFKSIWNQEIELIIQIYKEKQIW